MKEQVSRYELNRMVKQVLVRHAVNLMQLQFSSSKETIYLYGDLVKDPEGPFTPSGVEVLIKDLSRMPHVKNLQFNFNNWNISGELDSWQISKRK